MNRKSVVTQVFIQTGSVRSYRVVILWFVFRMIPGAVPQGESDAVCWYYLSDKLNNGAFPSFSFSEDDSVYMRFERTLGLLALFPFLTGKTRIRKEFVLCAGIEIRLSVKFSSEQRFVINSIRKLVIC